MFTLHLAIRNLLRQFRRSAFSTVSIVAGVAVIILGRGFTGGFEENIIRASIDTFTSHLMALPADYPQRGLQHPVDHLLTLPPEAEAWLGTRAKAWTRRTLFVPRAVHGADAMRIRAIAFDPATDEAVFPRTAWEVDGRIPTTRADGILVSTGVAKVLDLHPGDALILETRTMDGALNALEIPVAGVYQAHNPMLDVGGAFLPADLAADLIQAGPHFSHLCVLLPDRDGTDAAAAALAPLLGSEARVRTWWDEAGPLVEAQKVRQQAFDFLAFILLAIAAAGIANTVLMAAYERVREIGTLQALGMTRAGVVRLFVTEGLLMGIAGAILGAALGGWVIWDWSVHGLDISGVMKAKGDSVNNIPLSTMLYTPFSEAVIAGAMGFGVVVAVLASVYPALLASRMSPADAVRSE